MEKASFVQAYRRDAREYRSFGIPLDRALVRSRDYAHRWGELLHDLLNGREPVPAAEFHELSREYSVWMNDGLGGLIEQAEGLIPTVESAGTFHPMMELNFHRLNGYVQALWTCALYPPAVDPVRLGLARFRLATYGTALYVERAKWLAAEDLFERDFAELRAYLTGVLTEVDMYVALLELTVRDPAVAVLPAPAQFEHLAGSANVDFVVVDLRQGTAIGVQAKASHAHQQAGSYDRDRVVLLDGMAHLGNQLAVRTRRLSSEKQIVAWPGMVSANYIREMKVSTETDLYVPRKLLLQHKFYARRLTLGLRSDNVRAFATVDRILRRALAGGPVDPVAPHSGASEATLRGAGSEEAATGG